MTIGPMRTVTPMLLTVLLAACIRPSEPTRPAHQTRAGFDPRTQVPSRTLVSRIVSPTLFEVVGEDNGVLYTLDMTARRMTTSRGDVLLLDGPQTNAFAGAFRGIVEADKISQGLSAARAAICAKTPCLAEPYSRTSPALYTQGNRAPIIGTSSLSSSGDTLLVRTPWYVQQPTSGPNFSTAISYGSGANMCTDVVNAVVPKNLTYREKRTKGLEDVFAIAVSVVGQAGTKALPAGSGPAIQSALILADHAYARISISVLGAYWNAWHCDEQTVRVGPYMRTGTEDSHGGFPYTSQELVCHFETWYISFDNWQTSKAVLAQVCEYKKIY